jgi:hypothetical protein
MNFDYDRGYEDGFNDGQEAIMSALKTRKSALEAKRALARTLIESTDEELAVLTELIESVAP